MPARRLAPALAAVLLAAAPAPAQPSFSIEGMTDYRVRGLSWSGGRPTAGAGVGVDLPAGLYGDAWAVAARGAARHGGADAAVDLALGHRTGIGALSLDTGVIAHVFPGGTGAQDFAEGRIALEGTIGPVSAVASAAYAPRQRAIGGDLLHLRLAARAAVIGTPFTLRAQIGHTSGDTRDPVRALRLRPERRFLDWLVGADHVSGPLTLGIAWSDTDIGGAAPSGSPAGIARRHAGAVLVARAALGF